ncbi:MAG TPA: alpha/beta hydrolase [Pyrinomonadaceae bacterium]|nr:alpha/beta hydrolase [Pyrinomonadaceae bacterium]
MKKLLQVILVILTVCSFQVSGQNTANIEGNWLGAISIGGAKVRFFLKISKDPAGLFMAKIDSLDQGATDLPVDTIVQESNLVRFAANNIGLDFEGTLNEKGDEISGGFKRGASSLPVVFKRTLEVPKSTRPQDPAKPYPYNEEEITYENKKDSVKLAGTLTLPRVEGQHPAVILITGSGSQDRNSTVAGHRIFVVLADYLTRRGIAVLRVDDRGIGRSAPGPVNATSEDFAGDVLTGVEYLKSRKEINPKQIGLIGHSEGGMIAPLAASRSTDVAFIILLAGPGQTGDEIVYGQNEQGIRSNVTNPILAANALKFVRNLLAILKSVDSNEIANRRISEALQKQLSQMTESEKNAFAPIEAAVKAQIPMMMSPWYRYFLAYDPRLTLQQIKIPVLALNGENDTQVPAKENLDLVAAALRKGGNKDYMIRSFPKLNHLFQTSRTGLTDEYGEIEETFAPLVMEIISDWILKKTVRKGS